MEVFCKHNQYYVDPREPSEGGIGSDINPGTKEKPLATLQEALNRISKKSKIGPPTLSNLHASKTLHQACQEFSETWRKLALIICYELKINKILDWLSKQINKTT